MPEKTYVPGEAMVYMKYVGQISNSVMCVRLC
jgi:hypothetical protein